MSFRSQDQCWTENGSKAILRALLIARVNKRWHLAQFPEILEGTILPLSEIKVSLDLLAFKAYPGIFDLIRKGIRSSLYLDNRKIYDQINVENDKEKNIFFFNEGKITKDIFLERIELLLDPQTCGPLLISCNPIYEKYFTGSWYKVGSVSEKN